MNLYDKSQEEMLDGIREYAKKARDAAHDLAVAVTEILLIYPNRPDRSEMLFWQKIADRSEVDATEIAARAEELADAEDETAEGGEE